MSHAPVAVLDANVLLKKNLQNFILNAAAENLVTVIWSEHILDTVIRIGNKSKNYAPDEAVNLVAALQKYFPDSEMEPTVDATERIRALNWPDPSDDAKVAALALSVGAEIITTDDAGSGFPPDLMAAIGVKRVSSSKFLTNLFREDPETMGRIFTDIDEKRRARYGYTTQDLIDNLSKSGATGFAKVMADYLTHQNHQGQP